MVTFEKLAAQIIYELETRGCWKEKLFTKNQIA
jgi:hypothetical protein